ncbi:MAG TPA: NAD(P)H-binding protein [bacterium]|nr:NAD(P)H-binding protein [bacterium]
MDDDEIHVATGAFGFSGRAITRRLLATGRRVLTLTGHPARPNPFGDRVRVAPYRFDDPNELARTLRGAAVLYNTYWVRFPHRGTTFDTAVESTRVLVQACRAADVRRIVHLSVTNAAEDSPLPYFRGKAVVERIIRESGLSYAILRPALVYGSGDILVNNIAWFLRRSPVFPVMGNGGYRLQCVDVDDLAEIAVEAGAGSENAVADVVGPETHTFDGVVRLIARAVGSRARLLHTPPGVVRALLAAAGAVVRDVVLTRGEIAGLMAELLVSVCPPIARGRFSDWVARHGETLGRTYASELARHFR